MNGNTTIARGLSTRKAFIDSSLQAEFEENGYVLIPGVLHKDSIAALSDVYDRFSPSVTAGFHVTNWIKDPAYSAASHEKIAFLLAPKLKGILNNYRPVLGCFAVKEKGRDNTMGLHQDWSLTDESAFCGISAWVPLIDVAADSGALQMLRGSHRLFRNIRGQKISNQLDRLSAGTLHQYLTSVPMKAGDMLLLHHRIVHCSGPAMHRRIAAMMAMIPEEGAPEALCGRQRRYDR
ncbi:unnamed protein product [Sphagnum jensenii]|uniref:Phytanoyl-CoA dioxygenase n=1 Tax=Sphagnum jensenii TaxID=128206 RepID=A0ABP0V665_9BRYO